MRLQVTARSSTAWTCGACLFDVNSVSMDSCLHGEMSKHMRARHGLDKLLARFFNAGVVDCVRSRVEHFANACVFRLGRNTECRANLMKVQCKMCVGRKIRRQEIRRQYGHPQITYFESNILTDTTVDLFDNHSNVERAHECRWVSVCVWVDS
jgi:hypothetical protein